MEQTDEPQRELILVTPSSLQVQDNEASVATFLEYLEAFYESLETAIEEVEISERSLGRAPNPLPKINKQYEGQYRCECSYFYFAMGYLIKLLYETMRKGSESKQGAKLLTEDECRSLFEGVAIHAGFFNIFTYLYRVAVIHGINLNPFGSLVRLIDFIHPLNEQEWETIGKEATRRIKIVTALTYQRHSGSENHYFDPFMNYRGEFLYHSVFFGREEIDKIVSEVIQDGEEKRLRRFIEALHGTLQFLADTAPLAHRKIKTPIFVWDKRNEALDVFQKTIDLLRTVVYKQEVTPQKSATTLVAGRVSPPTKVTLLLRKEEHTGNMHTYHLTLTDNQHLSEPVPFLLRVADSGEAELFEDDSDG